MKKSSHSFLSVTGAICSTLIIGVTKADAAVFLKTPSNGVDLKTADVDGDGRLSSPLT